MGLLGPVSCLDDVGPGRSTTENACNKGDHEGCECPDFSAPGKRYCRSDNTFTECLCDGCTIAPDCNGCSKANDQCERKCCLNASSDKVDDLVACRARCAAPKDGGDGTAQDGSVR